MQSLSSRFSPDSYDLLLFDNDPGRAQLVIQGQKVPPPSMRITLHQEAIRITKAKVIRFYKRISEEHEVIRINHLNSRQEVRLHCGNKLFPGRYEITLEFQARSVKPEEYRELPQLIRAGQSLRRFLPCIDEPEARATADFAVSYTSAKK